MAYRLEQNIWTMRTSTGALTLEDIARSHLRPFYLYDLEDALMRADLFCRSSFAVHFAMKANTNPTLLRRLANRGVGADVVSLGELQKAIANGFEPKRIVFSGVAKDREELEAALHHDIAQINVESFAELQLLSQICLERRCVARVGLRINIRLSAPTPRVCANDDARLQVRDRSGSTARGPGLGQGPSRTPRRVPRDPHRLAN